MNPAYETARQGRWLRPDAHRWLRPDAARFLVPGTDPASVFPALQRKFNPDQPRVPAGNPDGGQWTGGESSEAISDANVDPIVPGARYANVVRICVAGSRSLTTDYLGNKTFWVIYDCAGGRSFRVQGTGHSFPGILLDRFR